MHEPSNARARMVDHQLRARGIVDQRVLEAVLRVPRHEFVPEPLRGEAYEDHPLPIGEGQTISQPYIVALMLEGLELTNRDRVLEVGTGSGYATALLAEIVAEVFSIERHAALASRARNTLASLGYANIKIFTGDGSLGLATDAPFDAILVSAAAPSLPRVLVSQLTEGGRMIVPVGSFESQQLQLIRIQQGQPIISLREPVRFVPLLPGTDAL
jgi:protein-L-isoaspartate(D-aspartate) O-methyltransferase